MSTPRSNFVKLRLTDLEKADWREAAGGDRKVSEWLRGLGNAECERQRELRKRMELTAQPDPDSLEIVPTEQAFAEPLSSSSTRLRGGVSLGTAAPPPVSESEYVTEGVVILAEQGSPVAVLTNITEEPPPLERALADEGGEERDSDSPQATETIAPVPEGSRPSRADEGKTQHCPRWTSHRPGTYCGTCKTVTPR